MVTRKPSLQCKKCANLIIANSGVFSFPAFSDYVGCCEFEIFSQNAKVWACDKFDQLQDRIQRALNDEHISWLLTRSYSMGMPSWYVRLISRSSPASSAVNHTKGG